MINRIISHYKILEELGKGAMGAVYLAEDTSLARRVAIKFADPARDDQEFRARFQREARLAASLNHRNIATVYDFGETEDGLFEIIRWSPHLIRTSRVESPVKELEAAA